MLECHSDFFVVIGVTLFVYFVLFILNKFLVNSPCAQASCLPLGLALVFSMVDRAFQDLGREGLWPFSDVADNTGSHKDVHCTCGYPDREATNDVEDCVVSEFNRICTLKATSIFVKGELEEGKEPGKDHSYHGAPPADCADPPAEPSVLAVNVEEVGNELHH